MRFESRRGQKKKKIFFFFGKLENLFLFFLFCHYFFSFTFQRWFLNLEVKLP